MALSGSSNYSLDAEALIKAAYRKLGINVTLTSTQEADALVALNTLIKSWGPKGLKVWLQEESSWSLVADTASVSITGLTTDLPLDISNVFLRDSNSNDTPMEILSRDEYKRLPDKTTSGVPTQVYYHADASEGVTQTGTLYVWPVPTSTEVTEYDLYFSWRKPIDDLDAKTDDIEIPNFWYRALIWNLAKELLLEVDVPESVERRIVIDAGQSLMEAEDHDTENSESIYFQPDTRWA